MNSRVVNRQNWIYRNGEIQKVIRLVDQKDLQSTPTKIVASQVDLTQQGKRHFKVITFAYRL